MLGDDVEERAERLRILLSVSEYAERPSEGMRRLSDDDLDALADLDADDLALASACFAVQADFRARGFEAVAELGDLIRHSPEPIGDLGTRVMALPEPQMRRASWLVLGLGWLD